MNGAVDSGGYGHLSVPVVIKEIKTGDIFDLLNLIDHSQAVIPT